jgi:hypothetical protein
MIDGYTARHKLKEVRRHVLQYKVNVTEHRLLHNPLILPMHLLKLKSHHTAHMIGNRHTKKKTIRVAYKEELH